MKHIESFGYVTPKDYSAYVKFNILKGKYYRLKSAFLVLAIAAVAALLLLMGIAAEDKKYFVIAGAIVLCSLMFIYTVNVNVKNICNKKAKVIRAKQKTVFGKNGFLFELIFDNPEENEYNEIFYDELEKIYLAPKAIYIYIEKRSVIVIPKRNLSIAPNEACEFLKKYIPAHKLVICA